MVSQRFATTLPTYEYQCPCGGTTLFEYDGGFIPATREDPGEGPDYFGIKDARGCITADQTEELGLNPEDACTLSADTFDDQAYDAFADWWHQEKREEAYWGRYDG